MPISAAGNSDGVARATGLVGRGATLGSTPAGRFAEHGFTPSGRFAEHGFTLVELMVVVTVIALASAVAALAIPANRGAHEDAARFAVRARAAHGLAITGGSPVAVWITGVGYGFDLRAAGAWTPIADQPLRVERWDKRTRVSTGVAGRLRVVFDVTGMADRPAELRLARGDDAASVAIAADGSVTVR